VVRWAGGGGAERRGQGRAGRGGEAVPAQSARPVVVWAGRGAGGAARRWVRHCGGTEPPDGLTPRRNRGMERAWLVGGGAARAGGVGSGAGARPNSLFAVRASQKEGESRRMRRMYDRDETRRLLKTRFPELLDYTTPRRAGEPRPEMQKQCSGDAEIVDLPQAAEAPARSVSLAEAIASRKSHRKFSREPLSLAELSYLLWATQGLRHTTEKASFRTVPSGGARHPFETYLFVTRVEGLAPGLYRYLPFGHKLCVERRLGAADGSASPTRGERANKRLEERPDNQPDEPLAERPDERLGKRLDEFEQRIDEALLGHHFGSAVDFVWAAVPYRSEWAYAWEALRLVLLDAGHVCAHLYLACEDVGCGTCAVGAYDQEKLDALVGLDGREEFAVYAAPVGKVV